MTCASGTKIIEHRIGVDGDETYTVRDADGDAVDLSSASDLDLTVYPYPGSSDETADETAIAMATTTTTGMVVFTFDSSDLSAVTPGDYTLFIAATISDKKCVYPLDGPIILRLLPAGD